METGLICALIALGAFVIGALAGGAIAALAINSRGNHEL
jgi:hypothetical protein